VNDLGAPPPDWDSIFQQARRRMAGKLLLVAVIAAAGTMLLLGGGLQAEGAVSLPIPILNKSDHHKERQQEHKHEKHKHHREQQGNRQPQKQAHHEKQENHGQHKHHAKPCKEEPESSAEEEYGRWDGGKDATGGKCPSGDR
jgi:hypothetical protein